MDRQQQPTAAKPALHRLPGPAQSLCRGQQHQTGLLDDEAGVDTLPSLLPPPARRPRPLACATAGGEHGILLALGILSGGGHTELRDAARQTWLRFDPVGQSVVACFAVGVPPPAFGDALHAEMARHADLIFVNATAVADGSAMQAAFGWWLAAPARFPRATYIGKTDDDSFVHIPRLLAHLGGLSCEETTGGGRAVYAGHLQFTTPNPRKAEGCTIWANNFERSAGALREEEDAPPSAAFAPPVPFAIGALQVASRQLAGWVASSVQVRRAAAATIEEADCAGGGSTQDKPACRLEDAYTGQWMSRAPLAVSYVRMSWRLVHDLRCHVAAPASVERPHERLRRDPQIEAARRPRVPVAALRQRQLAQCAFAHECGVLGARVWEGRLAKAVRGAPGLGFQFCSITFL